MTGENQETAGLQETSLAEPFAFRSRLRRADTRLDFIPVLDLIVIALLVSLLFTRFVSLPGVRIDLPITEMRMQHTQQAVAVLTIGNSGMLFFDGTVYEGRTIRRGFEQYVESSDEDSQVLLVKADSTMDLQEFLRICELAKEAGFIQVQLAGKGEDALEPLLPAGGQDSGVN